MIKEVLHDAESRMKSAIEVLEHDLSAIRTGRASTALVEKITVDYYDTPTPLIQLASLSVPEAQTIMIRPFDKGVIGKIEKAILTSDIGLTPNNDGQVIRLNLPALTQDRRKDLVKQVHKRLEESKIAIRNIRRSAISDIQEIEKEKMASEDESEEGQENVQKLTDRYVEKVDEVGKHKEKEIMEF